MTRPPHSERYVRRTIGLEQRSERGPSCPRWYHQRFFAKTTYYGIELHPLHVDKCIDRGAAEPISAANGALFQLWACADHDPNQTFDTTAVRLERR